MSPADRNKILIAAGVAVVAIAAILFFVLRGGKPAETTGVAGGFDTGAEGTAAVEAEAGAPAVEGEAPPAPGAAAPAGGPRQSVIQMGTGSAVHTRPDPLITFEPPPQPTPPELIANLPPVNLQEGGLRPAGVSEATEVARRRVAGLLFNDRAWAILEENGETYVVKPGDVIDGNRITAISRDSLYLLDAEGRRWQVLLRGAGPGAAGGASAGTRVPGMPEQPPGSM
jgi:hypothetical protein